MGYGVQQTATMCRLIIREPHMCIRHIIRERSPACQILTVLGVLALVHAGTTYIYCTMRATAAVPEKDLFALRPPFGVSEGLLERVCVSRSRGPDRRDHDAHARRICICYPYT